MGRHRGDPQPGNSADRRRVMTKPKTTKTKAASATKAPKAPTAAHGAAGKATAAKDAKKGKAAKGAAPAAPASGLAEERLSPGAQADLTRVRTAGGQPDPALDAALANAGKAKAEKKAKGPKKPGLLDLAAEVLKKADKPMGCKEMVEAVLAGGKWTTKGKTPAATLYSAIIREIADRTRGSRFKKVERGQFEHTK
jgi:hypothetical protein